MWPWRVWESCDFEGYGSHVTMKGMGVKWPWKEHIYIWVNWSWCECISHVTMKQMYESCDLENWVMWHRREYMHHVTLKRMLFSLLNVYTYMHVNICHVSTWVCCFLFSSPPFFHTLTHPPPSPSRSHPAIPYLLLTSHCHTLLPLLHSCHNAPLPHSYPSTHHSIIPYLLLTRPPPHPAIPYPSHFPHPLPSPWL